MSQVFALYTDGDSWLYRLDPRIKLGWLAAGCALAFAAPQVAPQIALLLGIHLLLWSAGVPWRAVQRLWRQLLFLALLIVILQPLFIHTGREWGRLGPLVLTEGGVMRGLVIALRALNLAFLVGALLFTTPPPRLVRALERLGLPYTWGLTLSLTLRFLPALQSLFETTRDAQAARGWTPAGNLWQRLRGYLPVIVAMIIGALRMSDQLTLALAARGMVARGMVARGMGVARSTWRDLRMRPADWVGGALLVGVALAWWLF